MARAYHILFCMRPSVIVWDLETVPDLDGFAAANDLVGHPDADVREVLGNKFPKHIYQGRSSECKCLSENILNLLNRL